MHLLGKNEGCCIMRKRDKVELQSLFTQICLIAFFHFEVKYLLVLHAHWILLSNFLL
jgi:hypothetical protein